MAALLAKANPFIGTISIESDFDRLSIIGGTQIVSPQWRKMLCKALFLCASMALVSLTLTTAAAWTIEPVVPTGGPLTHVVPKAISNAGHIVGYGTTSSGQTRAFLKYPGGNIVVLGALGGTESKAFDVSDNGVVVGVAKYANGTQKPFFTSPDGGAMSAVPLLPGWTGGEAVAVRPDGTMVGGWAHKPNFIISTDQPFWYGNFLGVRDFGLLPPDFTSCKMSGMNNRGTGSGSCTGAGKPRAFFIDPFVADEKTWAPCRAWIRHRRLRSTITAV